MDVPHRRQGRQFPAPRECLRRERLVGYSPQAGKRSRQELHRRRHHQQGEVSIRLLRSPREDAWWLGMAPICVGDGGRGWQHNLSAEYADGNRRHGIRLRYGRVGSYGTDQMDRPGAEQEPDMQSGRLSASPELRRHGRLPHLRFRMEREEHPILPGWQAPLRAGLSAGGWRARRNQLLADGHRLLDARREEGRDRQFESAGHDDRGPRSFLRAIERADYAFRRGHEADDRALAGADRGGTARRGHCRSARRERIAARQPR